MQRAYYGTTQVSNQVAGLDDAERRRGWKVRRDLRRWPSGLGVTFSPDPTIGSITVSGG
jgi:hypothetical protein